MDENKIAELQSTTTYDLAFNLAMGKYDADTKLEVLNIIKERDIERPLRAVVVDGQHKPPVKPKIKPPLKDSKTEKIYKILLEGKTAKEAFEILKKRKIKVFYPEIYRVGRDYFPERFVKEK